MRISQDARVNHMSAAVVTVAIVAVAGLVSTTRPQAMSKGTTAQAGRDKTAQEAPAATAEPIPNLVLVEAVGCLSQSPDGSWIVDHSELRRTDDGSAATAEMLQSLEGVPLGTQTFRLKDVPAPKPNALKGHKVDARGFIQMSPKETAISLTSLQSISATCNK